MQLVVLPPRSLIEGEGVERVRTDCSVCHATTFISSQPPLPGSTWRDEVYKMKEKYGATFISDDWASRACIRASTTRRTGLPPGQWASSGRRWPSGCRSAITRCATFNS